jgi:hypothetical protein
VNPVIIFRICAYPSCGVPIEADRARHAKYCKKRNARTSSRIRRRPSPKGIAGRQQDLLRLRTRIYVRGFRARKKLERELAQRVPQGSLT